ncbi:MAG: epoxyalkane--coenzyme M transferase, partial [Candidatus Binatia bacterium]
MKRSSDRIRTTHTGSLHRPDSLARLVFDKEDRKPVDPAALDREIRAATVEVLRRQVEAGVDVVSDGEMTKPSFVTYVNDRLKGFDAEHALGPAGFLPKDLAEFPSLLPRVFHEEGHQHIRRLACTGPVAYADVEAVHRDIANLAAARREVAADEAFMTAVSPGTVDMVSPNQYYATSEEYHYAIADALRVEYEAITNAGLVLQVDCPDLAMGR